MSCRRAGSDEAAEQLESPICKVDCLTDATRFDGADELMGGGLTGIDQKIDSQLCGLFAQRRILDASNAVRHTNPCGGVGGEDIGSVRASDSDEHVCPTDVSLFEGCWAGTVPDDNEDVEFSLELGRPGGVRLNEDDVLAFG